MAFGQWKVLAVTLGEIPEPPATQKSIEQPWLVAVEEFGSATHLKIMAAGSWTVMRGLDPCGPDGLPGFGFPEDKLLVKECPVGALVGRFGGSSATLKLPGEGALEPGCSKPFGVGSHCVIKLPDNAVGPLFIGFNSCFRPISLTRLQLQVWGSAMPPIVVPPKQ